MDEILKKQWHPVCLSQDLAEDKPLSAVIMGEDVVIWRSNEKICAWKNLCPHRGTALSLGKVCNNRIRCPYHGWEFNSDGQCEYIPADPNVKIPAKAKAVAIYHTKEYAGLVWVCISDEPDPLPTLPEMENSDFRVIPMGPYKMNASVTRVVENFLDVSHPPILHEGYLGDPDHAQIGDLEVEMLDDDGRFLIKNVPLFQPDPDGTGSTGKMVYYDFGVLTPNVVYFIKHIGNRENHEKFIILFPIRVVDELNSYAHFCSAYNYASEASDESIKEFHSTIITQDKPIVESQRPELVPVDLGLETLVKSDLPITRYRRYIKKIGLEWGLTKR